LKNLKSAMARSESDSVTEAPRQSTTEEDLRSWAIQYRPSDLERMLWQARKVSIYDLGIDEFVDKMRERLEAQPVPDDCRNG
jgi:hypothetical protein